MDRASSPDGRAPSRPKRPIKRYRRFRDYDYSRGAEVLESIEAIPRFNPGFALHGHVVMPDHVHFNLWLPPGLPDPLKALGSAIRRFKTWTSTCARKRLGIATLWQQGFHDRICTSARLIRILPDRMDLGHRPESRYLPAIQERRYLEIAEGNEPTDFSRAACLDLNAAIVSIATSGEGVAVYWKAEGTAILGRGGATGQAGACPSGLPAPIQS